MSGYDIRKNLSMALRLLIIFNKWADQVFSIDGYSTKNDTKISNCIESSCIHKNGQTTDTMDSHFTLKSCKDFEILVIIAACSAFSPGTSVGMQGREC